MAKTLTDKLKVLPKNRRTAIEKRAVELVVEERKMGLNQIGRQLSDQV